MMIEGSEKDELDLKSDRAKLSKKITISKNSCRLSKEQKKKMKGKIVNQSFQ